MGDFPIYIRTTAASGAIEEQRGLDALTAICVLKFIGLGGRLDEVLEWMDMVLVPAADGWFFFCIFARNDHKVLLNL